MPYVDDNDPGNTAIGDPTSSQEPSWLDGIKRYVGDLLPQEKPRAPAVDMGRWGPVLESAGLGPDSPEHKLLAAISGHVNSAPIPREDSTGSKALGVLGNAIGAGFLRRAGASAAETQAPTTSMINDWRARRDLADNARMGQWQTGGSLMIPGVTNAVQSAELRRQADAALQRGYAGIYGQAPPTPQGASGARPAAPLSAPAGNPLQGAINGAQGVLAEPDTKVASSNWQEVLKAHPAVSDALEKAGARINPADPNAAKVAAKTFLDAVKGQGGQGQPAAQPPPTQPVSHGAEGQAPGVTRAEPGRSADEPQYPLDGRGSTQGNSPIRFHLPDSALQADVLVRRALEENAARVRSGMAQPSKSTEEALKQEANTPGSVLQKAIADDRAAWQASPAYKARSKEAEEYAGQRVTKSAERMKGFQDEAETVKQSAYDLDLFEGALNESVRRNGENATGALADWKLSATKVAKSLGWPGADVGPEEVMKDWGNRVAGQAAKELTNRVTQSEFKIYRDSVPALTNTVAGNRGIIAASRALNDAKTARMAAANEYLSAMEASGRTPVLDHKADAYVNEKSRAAFDKADTAFRNLIDLAKQSGGGGQATPGGAPAPIEGPKAAEIQKRWQGADSAQRTAIEQSLKDRGYDPQAVLGGQLTTPAAQTVPAAAPATDARPDAKAAPLTRKLYDWMYPNKQEADLEAIRKLGTRLPQGPT